MRFQRYVDSLGDDFELSYFAMLGSLLRGATPN